MKRSEALAPLSRDLHVALEAAHRLRRATPDDVTLATARFSAFWVRDGRRHLMTPRCLEGPADMVIEIAPESDPRLDYREKLPRYRQAAIEEIWLVNPFDKTVLVETRVAADYASKSLPSGRLGSQVLPGFWIEISWLWQEELPPPLQCLGEILGSP